MCALNTFAAATDAMILCDSSKNLMGHVTHDRDPEHENSDGKISICDGESVFLVSENWEVFKIPTFQCTRFLQAV